MPGAWEQGGTLATPGADRACGIGHIGLWCVFFFILELIVKIRLKLQMFSFSGSVEGLVRQVALSRAPRRLASARGLTTVVLGPDRPLQTASLSSEEKMRCSARRLRRWGTRESRKGQALQRQELPASRVLTPHPPPPCCALSVRRSPPGVSCADL